MGILPWLFNSLWGNVGNALLGALVLLDQSPWPLPLAPPPCPLRPPHHLARLIALGLTHTTP